MSVMTTYEFDSTKRVLLIENVRSQIRQDEKRNTTYIFLIRRNLISPMVIELTLG